MPGSSDGALARLSEFIKMLAANALYIAQYSSL